ncbi:HalOD1 output domain-containing protein [Haloprofundus halobius]|uniref:HalOD1 output domain-containing protein n=1 Tax=Haloprofundus halobius TaxID=2876194 RepID=UPI001CC93DA2|nr:HalOD1 output domain-containing protein [Haloprofundus halobius]
MTTSTPLITSGPNAKTYRSHSGERPSDTVLRAVADATNVDPLSLPPLFESLDPDALDAILDDSLDLLSRPCSRVIEFHYAGSHVAACDDGRVIVQSY